ncbi:MAG: hypothetical protein ACOX0N_04715 [Syntrophomonadaceae bacterium]|jgi:hypothetical protein|nr:hypothetical protein [Syntrophomonadaceae bacterium]
MLKRLARIKSPTGKFTERIGIIVAVRDEQQSSGNERVYSYKLLLDGQISGWLPGECVELCELIPRPRHIEAI